VVRASFRRLAALALLWGWAGTAKSATPAARWSAAWAAAMQPLDGASRVPDAWLTGATVRQFVRVTAAGRRVRLRLSNAFGTSPLALAGVHVARANAVHPTGAIDTASDRPVLFDGRPVVVIPPGAEWLSDPVDLPLAPVATVAVSLRLATAPAEQTGHIASHATSFFAHGDRLAAPDMAGAATAEHWLTLAAVEVDEAPGGVVAALGDSITDGSHSVTDANGRWPDILADALATLSARPPAVLNLGIGGNRVLLDGVGPNMLARLERDVLSQPGLTTIVLLEGINDIGTLTRAGPVAAAEHAALVRRLIGAYGQVVARAHRRGIAVIGATLLPFAAAASYHPDRAEEADRAAVNRWIRGACHFDGVVDLDKAVRDPAAPDHLLPAYDSGDHLHPSPAGYRMIGDAVAAVTVLSDRMHRLTRRRAQGRATACLAPASRTRLSATSTRRRR
jgi:lysophospholipase L1-like esterase